MALLAELTVPAEAFALRETVATVPSIVLELEPVVPTTESIAEYLLVRADGSGDIAETLLADSTVAAVETVSTTDGDRLYRIDWDASTPLFERLETGAETLVRGEIPTDRREWTLTFRFEYHDALEDFRWYCRRRDVEFRLDRLADVSVPDTKGYDVSPKQREALIVAHREGYFEIPRGTTLSAVADALDISTRAASERLRRGQTSLIANTLLAGTTAETDGSDGDGS